MPTQALEDERLDALGEQTTAERSAAKTANDVKQLRKAVRDEEALIAEAQNELAKLQARQRHRCCLVAGPQSQLTSL
jgi:hypothetical protein